MVLVVVFWGSALFVLCVLVRTPLRFRVGCVCCLPTFLDLNILPPFLPYLLPLLHAELLPPDLPDLLLYYAPLHEIIDCFLYKRTVLYE